MKILEESLSNDGIHLASLPTVLHAFLIVPGDGKSGFTGTFPASKSPCINGYATGKKSVKTDEVSPLGFDE